MGAVIVSRLSIAPVKATRVHEVDSIELTERGARGDRSFYLVDEQGEMINGKRIGALQAIRSDYDPASGTLTLTFPDGRRVAGPVRYDGQLSTRFFARPRPARTLEGPWSEAISEFVGRPLRVVDGGPAVDRGREAGVSLISTASLRRLAEAAGEDAVDARRFRMLIEVDGLPAHGEDGWIDREVRIGGARVRMQGNVGRCMVTTRNPDSGEVDLKTLHALASYRRDEDTTEPLAFGIYGRVIEGGTVRVGDPVEQLP